MLIASQSKAVFLESLTQLTKEGVEVTHEEMMRALQSVPSDSFQVSECHSVVDFALAQLANWRAKWLFSSAQASDTLARGESDGWDRISDVLIGELAAKIPAVGEPLVRKKNLLIVQYLIQRRLQTGGNHVGARVWSSALSKLAIFLNRLGCSGIARWLQTRAVFPPDTVGRTGA